MQGQALIHFLVECSIPYDPFVNKSKDEPDRTLIWILNVDGSASEEIKVWDSSWKIPDGHRLAYAMKFMFHVSNNEAEYEALIVGLQKAQILKITHFVRSDSQIVIGHVTGSFEACEDNMKKYLFYVQHLLKRFPKSKIRV